MIQIHLLVNVHQEERFIFHNKHLIEVAITMW